MTRGHRSTAATGLGTPVAGSPEGRLMEDASWEGGGVPHRDGLGTLPPGMSRDDDPSLVGAVSHLQEHVGDSPQAQYQHLNRTPEGAGYYGQDEEEGRGRGGDREGAVRSRRSFTETDEELTEEEQPKQRALARKQWDFKSSKAGKGGVGGGSRSGGGGGGGGGASHHHPRGSIRRQALDRKMSSLRAATVGGARPLRAQQQGEGAGRSGDPDADNVARGGSDGASEEDETLYKRAIMESAKFQQQLKAIADSGSSDPDSDIEPPPSAYGVYLDPRYTPGPGGQQANMMMMRADPRYEGPLEPLVVYEEEVVLQRRSGEKDFGFSVANAEEGGVYVKGLRPGGPAQLSHLQPLDRIIEVRGGGCMGW